MIKINDVVHRYKGQARGIDGVCGEIKPGELVAVVGPNGSGKSTLAKLLNGLLLPQHGSVNVDGLDTSDRENIWEVRRRVGLIMQNPENQLFAPTVEEDVALGPENLAIEPREIKKRVTKALTLVNMLGYEYSSPSELSGGQKQRVAIAGILAMEPKYLILDEAGSMLDYQGRQNLLEIVQSLKASGIGIVLITHNMNEILKADRVMVLANGQVRFSGTPQEVVTNSSLLREVGLDSITAVLVAEKLRDKGFDLPQGIVKIDELVSKLC